MNTVLESLKQVRVYVAAALGAVAVIAAEIGVDVIDVCEQATTQIGTSE